MSNQSSRLRPFFVTGWYLTLLCCCLSVIGWRVATSSLYYHYQSEISGLEQQVANLTQHKYQLQIELTQQRDSLKQQLATNQDFVAISSINDLPLAGEFLAQR